MSDSKAEEPAEREAVRAPASGAGLGPIPRGIEVLVKKASVDPQFRAVLLERRAAAADQIGLKLSEAERGMLGAIPEAQLAAVIGRTKVRAEKRRAFLGKAAAAMLAALGAIGGGCDCARGREEPRGIRPERPSHPGTKGIRPDRPEPRTKAKAAAERPDRP